MEFIAVVTVLIAMQLWGHGAVIQRDDWFEAVYKRLKVLTDTRVRLAAVILLPVLGLILVQSLLCNLLWGLPLLLFYIAVLLYSLGRGDFSARLDMYCDAWRRGDLEGAYRQAQDFEGFEPTESMTNARELHEQVRAAIFYQGFERWFAVVFWFVVLGPAAALAYRLFRILGKRADLEASEQALLDRAIHLIEWVPARVLALTFSVVGDFDRGFAVVSSQAFENTGAEALLAESGCAALTEDLSLIEDEQFSAQAEAELHYGQKLLSRSVVCWVAVLALMQLL